MHAVYIWSFLRCQPNQRWQGNTHAEYLTRIFFHKLFLGYFIKSLSNSLIDPDVFINLYVQLQTSILLQVPCWRREVDFNILCGPVLTSRDECGRLGRQIWQFPCESWVQRFSWCCGQLNPVLPCPAKYHSQFHSNVKYCRHGEPCTIQKCISIKFHTYSAIQTVILEVYRFNVH